MIPSFKLENVLSAVDKYVPGAQTKIKNLADKAKAYMNNLSELELKVMEATNHEPWGPHGTAMREITEHAFSSEGFHQIMGIIDQRLEEHGENWRLCYKALLLLEFLIKNGPMRVAEACSSMRMSQLDRLANRFEYKDISGKDEGVNVRQRARDIISLVTDDDKLRDEREKAAKNRSKYTGVSSSSMGYGSSSYNSYNNSSSYGAGSNDSKGYGSYSSGVTSSTREPVTSSSSMPAAAVPMTSHVQSGGGAADEPLDPVEATRRRIERLKAEGALPDATSTGTAAGAGIAPGLEDGSLESPKKAKKKLSDVRINPAISATFAKPGLLSPPAGGGLYRSPSPAVAAAAPAKPAAASIDLLGDFSDAAPAVSSAADSDWDSFTAAPAPAAAGAPGSQAKAVVDDDWNAFNAAPNPAPAKKGPLDLDDLLGANGSHCGAAIPGGPLPQVAFSSLSSSAAPASIGLGTGPSPGIPAVSGYSQASGIGSTSAVAADPFAASATLIPTMGAGRNLVPGKVQAAAGQTKLGPATAKVKDPFADLAML